MGAEDDLGGFGRELAAVVGRAGLHDDGLTLRRARNVERPADVVELPVVIEHVHLAAIEEDAALLVAEERVLVPGIPQRLRTTSTNSRPRL